MAYILARNILSMEEVKLYRILILTLIIVSTGILVILAAKVRAVKSLEVG